jgi:predicted enzyme related to lactoylglutathione lyase
VVYWHVEDILATVRRLLEAGAREQHAMHDVGGGGRLIASVIDVDGNVIGLIQPT